MAETKQTTAPTTANRDRRSALIWFLKGRRLPLAILMLPTIPLMAWAVVDSIVRGAPVYESVAMLLVLALMFLMVVVLEAVRSALADWRWLNELMARRQMKTLKKRLSALSDAQKAPFQTEQRCNLSPTEEVWVRHVGNLHCFPEVLYSKNSGQTWEKLPLRLSPWARFKCSMLDGEWPPRSGIRNLSCDNNSISFEVEGFFDWDLRLARNLPPTAEMVDAEGGRAALDGSRFGTFVEWLRRRAVPMSV